MPLTRQQLRTIHHGNSRILRSGGRLHAPSVQRRHARRHGSVRDATRSLLSKIPGHPEGMAAPVQDQWSEAEGEALASTVPGRLRLTRRAECQPLSLTRNNTPSRRAMIAPEANPPTIAENLLCSIIDPANAGLPADGSWEIVTAHEHRFCFEHWKTEWLIEYADRWMYPKDFNTAGVEESLDAMFEQYQQAPEDPISYRCASRAECNSSLWSQVDTSRQRNIVDDVVAYRIRWKLLWTPESSVDDLNFVQSSYKAQNERLGRRQSARVHETTTARAAKREEMRVVIDLEEWI